METTVLDSVNTQVSVFDQIGKYEHEQVVFCSDAASGLKAIIAIHNTTLGPALGGLRMWPYKSEAAALKDVLRLSRGMTYKASIAGLNLGGGKAVIIGDPRKQKNEHLFRAFGRYVDSLGGRYITAEDVGMELRDMEWIRMETKYVTGIPVSLGGSGDPSPYTGYGVYMGVKASAKMAFGSDSLEGKKVAVQGAGNVSYQLIKNLTKEGAKVYICDIFAEKAERIAKEFGAEIVSPDDIYDLDVDIFSPCALGGVVNDETIDRIKAPVIAGGANNILEDENIHGQQLIDKGVVYAPDYVINAGGLINVANELEGYDHDRASQQVTRIYDTMLDILRYSKEHNLPSIQASNILAKKRIENIGKVKSIYSSKSYFSGRLGELYMRDRA
jgi:leucine dehydrogenase